MCQIVAIYVAPPAYGEILKCQYTLITEHSIEPQKYARWPTLAGVLYCDG